METYPKLFAKCPGKQNVWLEVRRVQVVTVPLLVIGASLFHKPDGYAHSQAHAAPWNSLGRGADYVVFLKLFLRLPVVLSSSPLKILEGFCCGIHSNRIHVIRNDLICFIEEGLFCLYNGSKTDKIRNYIFQRGQSSMVAIGPVRLCLVKIYIYEKTTFWLKMIWHKIGPSKNCHISPSYTTGHGVSNDAKYSVVYSSHLIMMGTRSWCVTS